MYRFNFVDTRECDCGNGIQTVEHVMSCCIENNVRESFEKEAGKIWMDESKKAGNLAFDMKLIVAPFTISKLNEGIALKILNQSFKYLSDLSKTF